jgi:hypothetical protein
MSNIYIYIYIGLKMKPNSVRIIKSKGIYQPENLVSNGSSRHDDAAQAKQIIEV